MSDLNERITKTIDESGLSQFGIKVTDKSIKIGDDVWNSKEVTRKHTDEEIDLDGTSCTHIDYGGFDVENIEESIEESLKEYGFENCQIILVGGNDSYEGNDPNETVIKNPVCLHIF